jgi:hypothetical protein
MQDERIPPRDILMAELRWLSSEACPVVMRHDLVTLFEQEQERLGQEITRLNNVVGELSISNSRLEQQVAVERQAGARARAVVRELTACLHNTAQRFKTLHLAFTMAGFADAAPSLLNLLQRTLDYMEESLALVRREIQQQERQN